MLPRRRLVALLVAGMALIPAGAASADHDADGRNSRGGGDCAEAQDQCQDNDFSPTFDKSPVDISGNQICVMPASCSAPQAAAPMSFFPPDPTKVPEYVAAMFKLSTDLALAIMQGVFVPVVKFIGDFGTVLA